MERWQEAEAVVERHADPVARKLVLFYRLLAQGAGRASEIADFLAVNPDWPQRALLLRRFGEALALEPDDRTVLELCTRDVPRQGAAPLRCADAASRLGKSEAAAYFARQAWIDGLTDPAAELAFVRAWGRVLTPEVQWRRFDRLCWGEGAAADAAAQRQAVRVDAAQRPLAEARLALRRNDPSAQALASVLPAAFRTDPALVLEQVRWLRRNNQDAAAGAILLSQAGAEAEAAAAAQRRPAFWAERNLLARRALRGGGGDALRAYELARTHRQDASEQVAEAEFLAGWVALRRLDRPDAARTHFQAVADASRAAITQGRAFYWIGRAATALGDADGAKAAYGRAAIWATTFYGQLAGAALGEKPETFAERLRDPEAPEAATVELAGRELVRAALLLVSWGEPRLARTFVTRLDEATTNAGDRLLAARLALELGWPDGAVAAARRAGRDGFMLPVTGWPVAFEPPGPVEPAVSLAVMRQESSFDVGAVSPAGARGLMQLMPATARQVSVRLGEPSNPAALVSDPAYNMRLGTAYLQGLLTRFGNALPLALAGYNAGPGRVQEWVAVNGDPLAPASDGGANGTDMLDWVELIPFNETRNYVQRVIENVVVYRALRGQRGPHPLGRWQS